MKKIAHHPRGTGLSSLNTIKRLAKKKGTPMLEVSFGKKSIHFTYDSGVGVIGFSYPNVAKGIEGELRRLNNGH